MGEVRASASDRLTEEQEVVFDRVAAGEEIEAIARDFGLTARTFYRWAKATPERASEWEAAREASAHAHAEKAGKVLEDARAEGEKLTAAQASVAGRLADFHRWLAEKRGRKEYGPEAAKLAVNFDFGQLHLEALQSKGSMSLPSGRVVEGEFEVEDDGTDRIYELERPYGEG